MIKKNKKPARAEGLMVGPDETDGDAAVPSRTHRCFLPPVKQRNVPPNADNGDVL